MKRFDAIALVSTGIVSSLLTLSLRAAPAFGKTENSIPNVREERTLPRQNKSEYQPVIFASDASEGIGNQIAENGRTLALAAVGIGAAGVIWSLNRQNQTSSPQSPHQQRNNDLDRANPRLRQRLLLLVGGDRQTANRLIAGVKLNHPGKSINWVVEKVIYDLERDR